MDCDVLIQYAAANRDGLLAIETKFVEEEFSTCGFRRKGTNTPSCAAASRPGVHFSGCLYASRKNYRYWDQSRRIQTLRTNVLGGQDSCPFGGGLWQLWVNHTLVHAEANERGLKEAFFAVCAPRYNQALLKGGETIAALLNNSS